MGWYVQLTDEDGEVVELKDLHSEGGTYAVGGTTRASVSITFNYSFFYSEFLATEGLRWIDGKRAKDCVPKLDAAVKMLGINRYKDYWAPTPGNAGHMLNVLLQWAKEHPDGIFSVEA